MLACSRSEVGPSQCITQGKNSDVTKNRNTTSDTDVRHPFTLSYSILNHLIFSGTNIILEVSSFTISGP